MSSRQLTRHEMLTIARGIADGRDTTALAGEIGVDRSTLRGWLAGADFLRRVARSLSSPADMGEAALANLRVADQLDGEREASWRTRRKFRQIVEATFPDFFAADEEDAVRNREIALADQQYTVEALTILEERGWKHGTADEWAQGLTTARRRKANRRRHGLKWDWNDGLGCYFDERWDATRCTVRYADEAGMSDEEQRLKYGYSERDATSHTQEELIETNTRPLATNRDPRLPTTIDAARAFLEAVKGGADFLQATRSTICPAEVAGRNKKKGTTK